MVGEGAPCGEAEATEVGAGWVGEHGEKFDGMAVRVGEADLSGGHPGEDEWFVHRLAVTGVETVGGDSRQDCFEVGEVDGEGNVKAQLVR